MATRDLLSGPITLSAAKYKSSNVLHALRYPLLKAQFYARIERQRHLLSRLVAHHLGTDEARVTVSPQEYWLHGSFNLCVPVMIDVEGEEARFPQFALIRFPLPYSVGEETHRGNSDEKLRTEAATYAWIGENCPDVPIPRLYGFGLSTKQRFSHVSNLPWWSRWFQHVRRLTLTVLGREKPSQLVPHQCASIAELDVGYLLIQTITAATGTMLSDSWDDKYTDPRRQENLQRDLARIMLSLARTSLPHIGAFRIDDAGCLRLDNRPLARHTLTSVRDFVLRHIDDLSARLLQQPNATESREDAHNQMASLAGAAALLPQLFRRELDRGPFVLALTDLHRSNILVDDDWRVVGVIDLEFACSWPVEFVQPPHWLGGEMLDEITIHSFADKHEGFLRHVEHEEALMDRPSAEMRGGELLSTTMRQGWSLGTFWATLALMHPIAFTEILYDRLLRDFLGASKDEANVDRTFYARFWRKDIDSIVEAKLRDYEEYNKELSLFFAEDATSRGNTI
ncbi:hypothetical protein LLEC1_04132 [Akanthomyces lecanii]|uniref:Aminoglycoside phosphotransferase domain-containing protein n=1 Tax=Cordyceps confragosa TaxID=2714763 RepID=A0A179IIX7_CORDF|nr:hypothetical protein LLEC1_04132 [Akanthomyces lecanii]